MTLFPERDLKDGECEWQEICVDDPAAVRSAIQSVYVERGGVEFGREDRWIDERTAR